MIQVYVNSIEDDIVLPIDLDTDLEMKPEYLTLENDKVEIEPQSLDPIHIHRSNRDPFYEQSDPAHQQPLNRNFDVTKEMLSNNAISTHHHALAPLNPTHLILSGNKGNRLQTLIKEEQRLEQVQNPQNVFKENSGIMKTHRQNFQLNSGINPSWSPPFDTVSSIPRVSSSLPGSLGQPVSN